MAFPFSISSLISELFLSVFLKFLSLSVSSFSSSSLSFLESFTDSSSSISSLFDLSFFECINFSMELLLNSLLDSSLWSWESSWLRGTVIFWISPLTSCSWYVLLWKIFVLSALNILSIISDSFLSLSSLNICWSFWFSTWWCDSESSLFDSLGADDSEELDCELLWWESYCGKIFSDSEFSFEESCLWYWWSWLTLFFNIS